VLPSGLELPEALQEGDYIELGPLGAYGAATATRFNGYGGGEAIEVEGVLGA
jgi:ornithine decarboxylase